MSLIFDPHLKPYNYHYSDPQTIHFSPRNTFQTSMGSVVISLDAELGWGHQQSEQVSPSMKGAEQSWIDLLELFNTYDIKATWAIVGHLFQDYCDGEHGTHPTSEDWFRPEINSNYPRIWTAQGMVEKIMDSLVDHEIGAHSYSHVEFGDPSTSREIAHVEISKCVKFASELDIDLNSFIFPKNNIKHHDLLSKYNFLCYRANSPRRWYQNHPIARIPGKSFNHVFNLTAPPIVTPRIDDYGLVSIPASYFLFDFNGIGKTVVSNFTQDPVIKQVKLGLNKVIDSNGIFHLWFHPHDMYRYSYYKRIESILELISTKRQDTTLEVKTMYEVALEHLQEAKNKA